MGIIFTKDITRIGRDELNALYGDRSDAYGLFDESFLKVFALAAPEGPADEERAEDREGTGNEAGLPNGGRFKLAGAVRVISEGVETALLVDLVAAEGYGEELKAALVREAEKELSGRRVMVYGSREDLELYEELGYGRCKNAWTYYREGMSEADFLPAGYRFENEFLTAPGNVRGTEAGKTVEGAGRTEESKSEADAGKAEDSKDEADTGRTKDRITHGKSDVSTQIEIRKGYENTAFDDINTILSKAFGGRPHDVNRTKAAFTNSRYAVTAYDGDRLVGVARAVSDGKKFATILNVAVDPEYQGLSIGKNIVLKLSGIIDADVIVLNTHPGAVGFYNKLKEYRRNKYVFEKFLKPEEPGQKKDGLKDEKPEAAGQEKTVPKTEDNKSSENKKAPDWAAAMFTPKGYRFPDEY